VRWRFGDAVAVGVAITFNGIESGIGDQCHAFGLGEFHLFFDVWSPPKGWLIARSWRRARKPGPMRTGTPLTASLSNSPPHLVPETLPAIADEVIQ
jgi:hypothetical protein